MSKFSALDRIIVIFVNLWRRERNKHCVLRQRNGECEREIVTLSTGRGTEHFPASLVHLNGTIGRVGNYKK